MNWEPFISCAITGAGDTAGKHPSLPITPEQIADSAVDAARAGAAIVHIHVRDPNTGDPARDAALYREVVERIRSSEVDVILNLTTGMGGDLQMGERGAEDTPAPGTDLVGARERMVHVEELLPEICSLDCGSMNFDDASLIYAQPPTYMRATAARLQELGVKPELEVFDLGHLSFASRMIEEGLIDSPPFVQLCLGIPYGAPATGDAMRAMLAHLPEDSVWSGFAVGRMEMPIVAQSVVLGGNVRVGLEDNLYLDRGQFATNEQLVGRAREIIERLGARVIGPGEVRERLGLWTG
jgi:uncharacterized protein (DUF849 family)